MNKQKTKGNDKHGTLRDSNLRWENRTSRTVYQYQEEPTTKKLGQGSKMKQTSRNYDTIML